MSLASLGNHGGEILECWQNDELRSVFAENVELILLSAGANVFSRFTFLS